MQMDCPTYPRPRPSVVHQVPPSLIYSRTSLQELFLPSHQFLPLYYIISRNEKYFYFMKRPLTDATSTSSNYPISFFPIMTKLRRWPSLTRVPFLPFSLEPTLVKFLPLPLNQNFSCQGINDFHVTKFDDQKFPFPVMMEWLLLNHISHR